MNCERARELLPLDIYSDLTAPESAELSAHLADCADCVKDREKLAVLRQALQQAAPVPRVAVDVARIARESVASQYRSSLRWKRTALALGSLAATLLLILLVRPEIEAGNGQFVIRWSSQRPRETAVEVARPPDPVRDTETDQRIRILSDLIVALRNDIESSDWSRKQQLELVVASLNQLRLQSQARWDETKNDVDALYKIRFGTKDQGDQQ